MIKRQRKVSTFTAIIIFCAISIQYSQSLWTVFELSSLRDLNGTTSVIYYDVKSMRLSRNTYGCTGTITINDELKNYEVEIKTYYSASGNNDYVLLPFRKARTPTCDAVNDEYRSYLMKICTNTDLPKSDDKDKDLCPLFEKKKTFTITNCRWDTKEIPRFLKSGWYRLHMLLVDLNDIQVSGVEVNVHLH